MRSPVDSPVRALRSKCFGLGFESSTGVSGPRSLRSDAASTRLTIETERMIAPSVRSTRRRGPFGISDDGSALQVGSRLSPQRRDRWIGRRDRGMRRPVKSLRPRHRQLRRRPSSESRCVTHRSWWAVVDVRRRHESFRFVAIVPRRHRRWLQSTQIFATTNPPLAPMTPPVAPMTPSVAPMTLPVLNADCTLRKVDCPRRTVDVRCGVRCVGGYATATCCGGAIDFRTRAGDWIEQSFHSPVRTADRPRCADDCSIRHAPSPHARRWPDQPGPATPPDEPLTAPCATLRRTAAKLACAIARVIAPRATLVPPAAGRPSFRHGPVIPSAEHLIAPRGLLDCSTRTADSRTRIGDRPARTAHSRIATSHSHRISPKPRCLFGV